MPTHWYNVVADMPNKPAPISGPDGQPVPPEAMLGIFPAALVMQAMSAERWVPIPEEVREVLRLWRPSPLYRAHRLEAALKTPAKIFYKNESVSPAGSHKPNTAVAQAFYNMQAGIKRLTTGHGIRVQRRASIHHAPATARPAATAASGIVKSQSPEIAGSV